MAIHYNGAVQRTPGKIACDFELLQPPPRPPAAVDRWRIATCGQCMIKGLMGLRIVHVEPGSVPGEIVNVTRYEVGARFLDDEPAPTSIAMAELDTGNWVPYQEAPAPVEPEADEQ
jgi:hypothetical protein